MNYERQSVNVKFMHAVETLMHLTDSLVETRSSISEFGNLVLKKEGKVTPESVQLWNEIMEHFESLKPLCIVADQAMTLVLKEAEAMNGDRFRNESETLQ